MKNKNTIFNQVKLIYFFHILNKFNELNLLHDNFLLLTDNLFGLI